MSSNAERSGMSGSQICCVPGCQHASSSFFPVPEDMDRRKKWLKLIQREDLMDSNPHLVCEAHFEPSSILFIGSIKTLKKDSCPRINLPRSQIGKTFSFFFNTSKKQPALVDKEVQTDPEHIPTPILEETLTSRRGSCTFCRKKSKDGRKKSPSSENRIEYELFSYLCDKFLCKNFANAVKQSAIIVVKEKQ